MFYHWQRRRTRNSGVWVYARIWASATLKRAIVWFFCTYAKPFLTSFAEAISEHEMALNYNRVMIPAPVLCFVLLVDYCCDLPSWGR